jgi:hypothetical protein
MSTGVRLHVTLPILAVTPQHNNHKFVNIPAGSMIERPSEDLKEPGRGAVTFDGPELLAFTRDIAERTQRVWTRSAS